MGKMLPAFVSHGAKLEFPPFYEGEVGWGNTEIPNPYSTSSVADYPRGTKYTEGERVFFYTRNSSSKILKATLGLYTLVSIAETGVAAANSAVGDTTVSLTQVGTVEENQFAGGFLCCESGTESWRAYPVKSNTVATSGVYVVTLQHPLVAGYAGVTAITSGNTGITVYENMWRELGSTWPGGHSRFCTHVGVAVNNIPISDYFWCQGWGICGMMPAENYGGEFHEREYVFNVDGSIILRGDGQSATYHGMQHAGVLVPYTGQSADAPGYTLPLYLQVTR